MPQLFASTDDLTRAVHMLASGSLALVPTETVYGIGVAVSAYDRAESIPGPETGYGRIFTLKRRNTEQTVPWLVDGPNAFDRYGSGVSPQLRELARQFWPGALTIVVPAARTVPSFMRAADGTVALRASASPVVQELVHRLGSPLAVTSANTHGAPAPASFSAVEPRVFEGVDLAIDAGKTACTDASTIVAMREGRVEILRQGAIPADEILSALRA